MGDEEAGAYPPYVISLFTEIFGTAVMMFIGCMGCIRFHEFGPILPSFAFGFAILAAVQTYHHISPVHLNPGVSIAVVIMGRMNWKYLLVYLTGQVIGAHLGYGALMFVTPSNDTMCLLRNKLNLSVLQCFFNEMLCSWILIWMVLGAVDQKNKDQSESLALRVGFCITGIIFGLEPFTGAGLNATRALPPAIIHNNFENLWQYTLGPVSGMIIGATLYRFVFDDAEEHSLHSYLKG